MAFVVNNECILCGACIVGCPSDAIEEGETKCEIIVDLCIECGTCEMNCPADAIAFLDLDELEMHR